LCSDMATMLGSLFSGMKLQKKGLGCEVCGVIVAASHLRSMVV
jgi:hypothetical protein